MNMKQLQSEMMTAGLRVSRTTLAMAAAAVLALALSAEGAVYTNSASGNWSADGSWNGGKPPAGGAADTAIVFDPTTADISVNDLTGTFMLNRMEFVAGPVTLSGNALMFTNNGATGPVVVNNSGAAATFANAVTLAAGTTFNTLNTTYSKGVLSGKGGLIKTGPMALVIETNTMPTYVGSTIVSAGELEIRCSAATQGTVGTTNVVIQSDAAMSVTPYGTGVNGWNMGVPNTYFNIESNATLTINVPTIMCGYLTCADGGFIGGGSAACMSLRGLDTATRVTATIGSGIFRRFILQPVSSANPVQTLRYDGSGNGATVGISSGSQLSFRTGNATALHTYILDVADSPTAPVDLLVPYLNVQPNTPGFAIFKQGAGVMRLDALNWTSAAVPTAPLSGTFGGGTFIMNTSATNAAGVNFSSLSVASGATLQVGNGGTTGMVFVDVANAGTVIFNRSDSIDFTPAITGTGSLRQQGPGTLTFSGAQSYNGGTEVSAGTLLVNSPGALNGAGAVSVTGGTLGGDGSISGAVELEAGGSLAPGGVGQIGTLTLADSGAGALSINGGQLLFDLSNASGVNDRIDAAGNLVLNGSGTIVLAFPNGTTPAGTYTLLTYAAKTGSGTLALFAPYPNATLDVGDTAVTLTVTGSGITFLNWNGDVSGTWDTTTANWKQDGAAATYTEGDAVLFDDSAAGNYSISGGGVSPSSVTFNNSAVNYTLTLGINGGATTLLKDGASTVTLTGNNSYGGGTILKQGTLSVGAYANLPASGGLEFSGGTLNVTGTSMANLDDYTVNWDSFSGGLNIGAVNNTLTVNNAIGGSGSLAKMGAGTLALAGPNTFSGGATVTAGFLRLNHASALGAGLVTVLSGGQVDLTGNLTVTNAVSIKGVGATSGGEGAIRSVNGTTNILSGPITIAENEARLGCLGGGMLEVSGVISSGADPYTLVVRMPNDIGGTLLLSANNTWLGNTWIRCGTVRLGIDNALPTSTLLRLGLGAPQTGVTNSTFDLAGFDQRIAGVADVGTENIHTLTNSEESPSTLTIDNTTAYAYAGEISGNLNLVKTGASTLTLSGAGTASGGLVVSNGALVVSASGTLGPNCTNVTVSAGTLTLQGSACIDDEATLIIADGGGAKVNLAEGVNEALGYLYFGEKQQDGGTYGATGSGAQTIDDEHFTGSGILTVRHGKGGTLIRVK